jgi:DNA-binding NarL/FixJ family response regulator
MARLFLCDDDADYRQLLRVVLGDGEHEIVGEGCDGHDCLERAPASRFDALPILRTALPDAKIFILSSARRQDELQRVLSLGADGYIEKPHNVMSLGDQLQAALDDAA